MIDVSPTYLSKIERGDLPPPVADKIVAAARALEIQPEKLFAISRRLPADLQELITRNPVGMAAFLRSTGDMPDEAVVGLLRAAKAVADAYVRGPVEESRGRVITAVRSPVPQSEGGHHKSKKRSSS
jgi:hypothetical protein